MRGSLESIAWDTRKKCLKINLFVNMCKIADCLVMCPCFLHGHDRVVVEEGRTYHAINGIGTMWFLFFTWVVCFFHKLNLNNVWHKITYLYFWILNIRAYHHESIYWNFWKSVWYFCGNFNYMDHAAQENLQNTRRG